MNKPSNKLRIEEKLSVSELLKYFSYDKENGELRWKSRPETCKHLKIWNTRFAGTLVGNRNKDGLLLVSITVDGEKYRSVVHRIIWAIENGKWLEEDFQIDHINHDHSNNRIGALRPCTPGQNARNKMLYRNNTSGFKGVGYDKKKRKWTVVIGLDGQLKSFGSFEDPKLAAMVYDLTAEYYFGEFAKTNKALGLL